MDLLVRCLEKIRNILPNGGLMVIYHGRKQKITLNKCKMCFKSCFAFEKGKRVRQSETCTKLGLLHLDY